jgi:hypothetical protein
MSPVKKFAYASPGERLTMPQHLESLISILSGNPSRIVIVTT